MPSQSKNKLKHLCVFGDSNIAATKSALDEGLVKLPKWQITYWGAEGRNFPTLQAKDNKIYTTSPRATESIRKLFDGAGPELDLSKFDVFFLCGFRLRVREYFTKMLSYIDIDKGYLTENALTSLTQDWLRLQKVPMRLAKYVAQSTGKPVFLSPSPFLSEGVIEPDELQKAVKDCGPETRFLLWDALSSALAEEGITLIAQDESTVTLGIYTKSKYSVEGAIQKKDALHKNNTYAAYALKILKENIN